MRKESFLHADEKDQRKLEPLSRVQSHQRDPRAFLILIGVAHQRRVIQELAQCLGAIRRVARGIYQFLKIFNSGIRFRRSFLFQCLYVTGAVDEELNDLRQGRSATRRAEALHRCLVGSSGWRTLAFW